MPNPTTKSASTARRKPPARARGDAPAPTCTIRAVRLQDLGAVVEIDILVTGLEKRDYWQSLFRRYANAVATGQHFLVAELDKRVVGFVIGEVRDWEFGSPPCGWVFGIDVHPHVRLGGIATRLLQAICTEFHQKGVLKVRTMLARDNTLILSFFRSQGMMISPFIPLEMDLEP